MAFDVFARMMALGGFKKIGSGVYSEPRVGPNAQLMTGNARPFNADMVERRRVFLGASPAAGVTVPIYTNTNQQFVLFNPPGSGKKGSVLKAMLGYVSGTMVAGHLCYANQTLITNAITGTAGLVQQAGMQTNANAPQGNALQLLVNATVVAFTYLMPFGTSQVVQPATGVNTPWQMVDQPDGLISIYPGQALAIAANVAAAMVAAAGIAWEETDLDE